MKIAIIEAGTPPGNLAARHGSYPDMVRGMIGVDHEYSIHRAYEGDLPGNPAALDAIVITGSAAGVNDDLPWLAPLAEFIRSVPVDIPLAGICFGHQIIAHALGGRVERSSGGWAMGVELYDLPATVPGLAEAGAISVIVSHRDQVVAAPPYSDTLGGNAHAPHALLAYRDRQAISCQCHPEFTVAYANDLIAAIQSADLDDRLRTNARASLASGNLQHLVAHWMRQFVLNSHARR